MFKKQNYIINNLKKLRKQNLKYFNNKFISTRMIFRYL